MAGWELQVPSGTPPLVNWHITSEVLNPDTPELCVDCGHATVWTVQATVLHEGGVLLCPPQKVCGSDECLPEDDADDE